VLASRSRGRGRDRRAGPEVGRGREGGRGAAARRERQRGGAARALPRPAGRLQVPSPRRLRRRAAAQPERQGAEEGPARAVLGRPEPARLLAPAALGRFASAARSVGHWGRARGGDPMPRTSLLPLALATAFAATALPSSGEEEMLDVSGI